MASKYVTDDGLDLDSRYLGINAKAKSAETADKANSVDWESIQSRPTLWPKFNYAGLVNVYIIRPNKTWVAPSDGFIAQYCPDPFDRYSINASIDNVSIPDTGYSDIVDNFAMVGWFPINKGSTINIGKFISSAKFAFIPIVL